MALVLADRVQETTTSPGTGDVTLGGAVTGFRTFSSVLANNDTCYYTITDIGGSNWEVGLGTYVSSGNTLQRTTVYASSAGGTTKANFSTGSQSVFITYPAGRSVNLDSSGNVSALGTISSGTWQGGTIAVAYGGTGTTTSTGTGSVVLSTSPSLTTPNLGTPSAINLTNATALPLATGVSGTLPTTNGGTGLTSFTTNGAVYATSTSALTTGTLPVASGGTGTTTSTGSGSVVLSTSPSLTTPNLGTPSAINLTNGTALPLGTGVSGTLPIANGGTNANATPTNGGVAYGTGSAYAFTSAGSAGQVLTSNGTSAPTWQTSSGVTKAQAIAYSMTLGF